MSNLPVTQPKYPLPKLEELYGDVELASKFNDLNKLLNAQPKAEWVQINKFANNSKYLPIERVEYLLTTIFIRWRLEIISSAVMANSVVTIVRLHVLNPIDNQWDWQDGIGAAPIQTKKDAAATDFSQVTTAAVQMAAPASESMALKDAAEKFGKLFGKDLNRKDEINYAPMQEAKSNVLGPVPKELAAVIEAKETTEEIDEFWTANPSYHANRDFILRMKAQREMIAAKEVVHE
ncbi:MAG TPA: hypothetical protein VKQ08_05900 [Cyclobacteriaceae bacterium]|nr:hypothetical protein [Cyclobacteriaceae bacterium]